MEASHPVVYVIDDDPAVRQSVKALVESVDFVARTYESTQAFLESYESDRQCCLVLDVRMPGQNGFQLLRVLSQHGIRIPTIVITAYGDVPSAVEAMKLGAVEFFEKPFSPTLFLDRLQQILSGSEEEGERDTGQAQIRQSLAQLSPREREILKMLIDGLPNKDVARQLNLSEKTVSAHRSSILNKTHNTSLISLVYQIGRYQLADLPADSHAPVNG